MTLEELKQTDWYKERPELIKQAIIALPPIKMYQFKESKKRCHIVSFEEPESGLLEDVTCTVQKYASEGSLTGMLDTNQVFGVKINDLEPLEV